LQFEVKSWNISVFAKLLVVMPFIGVTFKLDLKCLCNVVGSEEKQLQIQTSKKACVIQKFHEILESFTFAVEMQNKASVSMVILKQNVGSNIQFMKII
jgi:hypothetical protein